MNFSIKRTNPSLPQHYPTHPSPGRELKQKSPLHKLKRAFSIVQDSINLNHRGGLILPAQAIWLAGRYDRRVDWLIYRVGISQALRWPCRPL